MKENRNVIEIQSTPDRVWEALTEFDKYPEWNPLLCRAEGNLAVGEKVNLTARSESKEMNLLCTVKTVESNRQFSWEFHVILPFLFRGVRRPFVPEIGISKGLTDRVFIKHSRNGLCCRPRATRPS